MKRYLVLLLLICTFVAPQVTAQTVKDSTAVADSTAVDGVTSEWPVSVQTRLQRLVSSDLFERSQVGICVYDLTADSVLFSHGERQLLRPASCEKLLTAITALAQLGGSYRFETKLCYTGSIADSTLHGDLYVVGGFDPRFGHDDLHALCSALHECGVWKIEGKICLDVSMKDTVALGSGWCWDDEATRLTPLLLGGDDNFADGLRQALADANIAFDSAFVVAQSPGDARFISSRFHTIDQILMRMMKKSDNLYAESLFYQLGAQTGISYASWKHSADRVKQLIGELGLNPSDYQVVDGSGLSLYNYTTPQLLTKALRYAWQRNNIYLHLYPSLPIAGKDGTLSSRMRHGSAYGNIHAKTGTVEGVSTLAGYATAANGHELCFAIMNQGLLYQSVGRKFQDSVCQAITNP